ncbi:MAG: stage II sporulation protein D [Oscillospiraceae bacterium]|jgi:stage II sporulation protein D|nr:stage II sporulation protein D [Oscillospiraceae bacterium]
MKKIIIASVALGVFAAALAVVVSLLRPWGVAPEEDLREDAVPDVITTPDLRLRAGGTVRVLDGDTIIEMPVDEYLTGVLAAEMPVSFEPDALAAQAVAARTYTFYKMRVAPSATHPNADVCTDFTDCAAYKHDDELREQWGADYDANIAKIRAAILETDGVYLEYGAEPILAAFHSSSFGATEDAERVWNTPLPYLVSVPSPETAEDAPNLISSVTLSVPEFKAVVASAFPAASLGGDRAKWIADVVTDDSGRVANLKLGGVTVAGTELRAAFGLRSAAITIEVGEAVTFTTQGYGHGVGMSQYGANTMAKNGANWREILLAYYTGAQFSDEIFINIGKTENL